jgi:hypothetical protein
MAFPPLDGAVQDNVSASTPADATGVPIVLGTVVAVAVAPADSEDVPEALVATTVKVKEVLEGSPVTCVDVDDVVTDAAPPAKYTVYEVAGGEPAGRLQLTLIAPSLKARLVPTSVAVTFTGVLGCRKSFCC